MNKRNPHNVTIAMDLYNSENTIVNLNNSVYNVFQLHQRHQEQHHHPHQIFDQVKHNVNHIDDFIHSNNMTDAGINGSAEDAADQYEHLYSTLFNWQGILLLIFFCTFIVITIIGNTLVILAVLTTRRLRTVTNCFVMSLAVADLLVGIFVMPPAVAVHFLGSWPLGWILCDIWISLDVLLCTASILSLCAISVDRYLAVTQPLTYSRKRRSKRLALTMILIVWVLALAITCPPILGWYEPGRRDLKECRYNQNEGYVIFSAMGSFFIPMAVMIYVYARISCVVASRHDNLTDIGAHNKKLKRLTTAETDGELDHYMSEQEPSPSQKRLAARSLSNQTFTDDMIIDDTSLLRQHHHRNNNNSSGNYELMMGSSRTPSFKRQPSFISANRNTSTSLMSGISNPPSNPAVVEQQWTYGGHQRHQSVRHHCVSTSNQYASDTYITRNTRILHQNQQASKSLANRLTILKKENKTTQTLSIVVGGFIACWLPFFIDYLITPFLTEPSKVLAEFLTWLGWFNSAINPFIYAFYSVDFRTAFWRLTFKRFCGDSSKQQFPSNTMSIRR